MGLIREPKNVDFSMKSEPWTKDELKELSEYIRKTKSALQNKAKKRVVPSSVKPNLQ